jgi:HAD superfamily hydrolase (TIGR01509 family)
MTTAAELITKAKALLLDFDGPVTALMPSPLNAQAADAARALLAGVKMPAEIQSSTDHLAVLRWTYERAVSRLSAVEAACTAAEVECARASEPSPEIDWLLAQAARASIPTAVVSNNSEESVRTFLGRLDWLDRFAALACRTPETARRLKPHPFLVEAATRLLDVAPRECVFVGDSVSDVEAGHAAGVPVIGLAKTPQRGLELKSAGADALLARASRSA